MKAISVKQPWAYLLCSGIKDIENRTWRLPEKMKGQKVLIHASGKSLSWLEFIDYVMRLDCEDLDILKAIRETPFSEGWLKSLPTGAIIGSVVFTDCTINHASIWAERSGGIAPVGGHVRDHEKPLIYNWVASSPILFDKPILNVKGKLSFWNYPNIECEPNEDGKETCCCQLGIDEKDQVLSYGNGDYRCKYCGGKWYK